MTGDEPRPANGGPARYRIRVRGRLEDSWSRWLGGMAISHHDDGTTLTGPVADQAALRGILNRLWDLNLTLVSLRTIGPDADDEAHTAREGDRP